MMKGIVTLLASVLLVGCSNGKEVSSYLYGPEKLLSTSSDINKIMHTAIDYPRGIALTVPGYVVGVEKIPRAKVTAARWQVSPHKQGGTHDRIPSDEATTTKLADAVYEDVKAHIVSHILEYNISRNPKSGFERMKGCALYNLYENDAADTEIECRGYLKSPKRLTDAFDKSWEALDYLSNSIEKRMQGRHPPTHILVYVMGWNTPQEEAIRNFNSLAGHLVDAAERDKAEFRPLIVGLTWPSVWRNVPFLPNALTQAVSYPNKTRDADEVGMSWLGVLMHDVLAKYRKQTPIVVVGHSFGARALTRAIFTGPAIVRNGRAVPPNNFNRVADLVISLQGAYSKNRFLDEKKLPVKIGREGSPYDHFRDQAGKVILTAATHDTAVDVSFWADMAGNEKSWKAECLNAQGQIRKDNTVFDCVTLNKVEELAEEIRGLSEQKCGGSHCKIAYLKADSIIRFNAAGTGGNAHSDVYRAPIGVLTWEAIKKYAPGKLDQKMASN